MSAHIVTAPCLASVKAVARPIPEAAPVTSATLSATRLSAELTGVSFIAEQCFTSCPEISTQRKCELKCVLVKRMMEDIFASRIAPPEVAIVPNEIS